jgi:hypothetical protein
MAAPREFGAVDVTDASSMRKATPGAAPSFGLHGDFEAIHDDLVRPSSETNLLGERVGSVEAGVVVASWSHYL